MLTTLLFASAPIFLLALLKPAATGRTQITLKSTLNSSTFLISLISLTSLLTAQKFLPENRADNPKTKDQRFASLVFL